MDFFLCWKPQLEASNGCNVPNILPQLRSCKIRGNRRKLIQDLRRKSKSPYFLDRCGSNSYCEMKCTDNIFKKQRLHDNIQPHHHRSLPYQQLRELSGHALQSASTEGGHPIHGRAQRLNHRRTQSSGPLIKPFSDFTSRIPLDVLSATGTIFSTGRNRLSKAENIQLTQRSAFPSQKSNSLPENRHLTKTNI